MFDLSRVDGNTNAMRYNNVCFKIALLPPGSQTNLLLQLLCLDNSA